MMQIFEYLDLLFCVFRDCSISKYSNINLLTIFLTLWNSHTFSISQIKICRHVSPKGTELEYNGLYSRGQISSILKISMKNSNFFLHNFLFEKYLFSRKYIQIRDVKLEGLRNKTFLNSNYHLKPPSP